MTNTNRKKILKTYTVKDALKYPALISTKLVASDYKLIDYWREKHGK
ncbi:hypothetical protein LCGC14_2017600 [marine sediment metagenome]|uniref:Uncharacterized protein n=1 Tax=marine sediment metagenome TaxID=412755 RepID=A0A0F9HBT2_9ZZZZ